MVYDFLVRIANPTVAKILCVGWFALVTALIIYCSFEPAAGFHYGAY